MQHQAQIDAARTPNGSYDYKDCFSLVEKQIKEATIYPEIYGSDHCPVGLEIEI